MHYKTTTKPRPINEIKIGDDRIMTIDVGCGWAVTDVWFDHDIPAELIDCIKVKFERKEAPQMSITNTNSGGNYSGIASVPEDSRVTDIICPNCGDKYLTWDGSKILTSNPPQYRYYCESCGFSHVAYSDSAMMDWVKSLDKPVCYTEAPQKCLNEHCEHAEVFKDKLMCTHHNKWFDLPKDPEDIVNHPSHYETGKFECIDVMRETQSDAAVQDFCICNALKYIYRHRNKNGVEDIRKAKWYIDKYLEIEEAKK